MMKTEHALSRELTEATEALAAFDVDRLDAVERRIGSLTPQDLASSFASDPDALAASLRYHATLAQLLKLTAINTNVLAAVLQRAANQSTR